MGKPYIQASKFEEYFEYFPQHPSLHYLFLMTGYKHYGLNRGEKDGQQGLFYREWAPGAKVGGCRKVQIQETDACMAGCLFMWASTLGNTRGPVVDVPTFTSVPTDQGIL